ncbi:GDSL-type esterase/lipase family protein [Paeniglutamicibacter cryotolerans]|uniref:Lysophospholipase L1-like esterase n=1 Tax=Paeniglutamicibacter cryotolerans TaxID=670079 RepID=A0A839QHW2_9MICC|nr:GDSL-type esterase/lipase family protein [Paeniglutamicibacter cryotolerans]MBB2995769.1 lysophospholipase L1-like esterase [Paeniglutamicibacter cryotolerans]
MARTKKLRLLTLFGTALASCALLATGLAPASAAVSPPATHHGPPVINYVNLGDSYSAGFGTGTIVAGPLPGCYQTNGTSQVTLVAAQAHINLLIDAACAGAKTTDVATAATAVAPYLAQADLVTLTLGGNDLGWSTVVGACSTQGTAKLCDQAILATLLTLPKAAKSANKTLRIIDAATPGTILLQGYPRLFSPEFGNNPLITAKRAKQLNNLADLLNLSLAAATHGTSAQFVSVSSRFQGHGIGSPTSWLYLNPANPTDSFNLHPTATGYLLGYYPALKSRINALHLVY